MSGGSTVPANRPNGVFTAYYGTGASCIRFLIDKTDWADSQKRSDKNLWAMSPQSGTVFDGPGFPGWTSKNGCITGWE
jgi:hypothetical protein